MTISTILRSNVRMRKLNAIIVEDEPLGMENLRYKIETYCPELAIVAECLTARKAIESMKRFKPDVVFLDVRLDAMTGFDVLKAVPFSKFEIIITTDYEEYAMKALKTQVLDYLVKPIKRDDLIAAVQKLMERYAARQRGHSKVGLPTSTGERYVLAEEILYLEAKNTRCTAFLTTGEAIEIKQLLGDMEVQLKPFGFCRPNKSVLVNLHHGKEFIRTDGGWFILTHQGKEYPFNITAAYKEKFHVCRNDWYMN